VSLYSQIRVPWILLVAELLLVIFSVPALSFLVLRVRYSSFGEELASFLGGSGVFDLDFLERRAFVSSISQSSFPISIIINLVLEQH